MSTKLSEFLAKQRAEKEAAEAAAKAPKTYQVSGNGVAPATYTDEAKSAQPLRSALDRMRAARPSVGTQAVAPVAVAQSAQPPIPPKPPVEVAAVAPEPVPNGGAASPETLAAFAELKQNLDFLANNIEQKDLVGQVVRTIGQQLAANPQFDTLLKKADFNLIVRGFRRAYNVAARKKVEGGEKRNSKDKDKEALEAMLRESGIQF